MGKKILGSEFEKIQPRHPIWIFGYGSLMWNPGFAYVSVQSARLKGYQRDLCILSYIYRGTYDVPGLVMGLNPGAGCTGRAFEVGPDDAQGVMAYLHKREMPHNVYEPSWVDVTLEDGRVVKAYTFVAVAGHKQHVGHFDFDTKVDFIMQGIGQNGTAIEYLAQVVEELEKLKIHDEALVKLLDGVKKRQNS